MTLLNHSTSMFQTSTLLQRSSTATHSLHPHWSHSHGATHPRFFYSFFYSTNDIFPVLTNYYLQPLTMATTNTKERSWEVGSRRVRGHGTFFLRLFYTLLTFIDYVYGGHKNNDTTHHHRSTQPPHNDDRDLETQSRRCVYNSTGN